MSLTKEQRAAVNRANAKKSTGPKTKKGKAASSRNAIKHGERATTLKLFVPPHSAVLGHEDRLAFYEFLDAHIAKYAPNDEIELHIVRQIADCEWKLNRDAEIETALSNFEAIKMIEKIDEADGDMAMLQLQVSIARALAVDPAIKFVYKRSSTLRREIVRLEKRYFQLKKLCPAASPKVCDAAEDKANNLFEINGQPPEQAPNEPKVIHVNGPITPRVVKMYQAMNPNRQIHLVPEPAKREKGDPEWPIPA
jgi:hypothetical protein